MKDIQKHVSQMTTNEVIFLKGKLKEVEEWYLNNHHYNLRIDQRDGSHDKVLELIEKGNLVSYQHRNGKSRVVVRGRKNYDGKNACAVFQFDGGKIITFYWNSVNSYNPYNNYEEYDGSLDIISLYNEHHYVWELEKEVDRKFDEFFEAAKFQEEFEQALNISYENEKFKNEFENDFTNLFETNLRESKREGARLARFRNDFTKRLDDDLLKLLA